MGISKNQTTSTPRAGSLADALFSGAQQRVLGLLFGQPERSFYATELINLAGVGSGAVSNQVNDVEHADLIFIIGSNPTSNHPVAATWMKNAAQRGTRIVLADPRVAERAATMQGFANNIGKYISLAYLEAEKEAF